MQNPTLIQFFHWYYPNDCSLWKHCKEQAERLSSFGITHIWLPPAYKSAWGTSEPGYAVYDLFDLGEFDQKGTTPTKYGTKEEYLDAINKCHDAGMKVIADIVLNHRQGGDEVEDIPVRAVNENDRNEIKDKETTTRVFTKFTFPGRKNKYSDYKWDWHSFSGVNQGNTIYSIQNEYGRGWDDVLTDEKGNYDYLMGDNVELRNPHVREELKKWGKWYVETTGIDGFRFDALKHMSFDFIKDWLGYMRQEFNKDFPSFGEYISQDKDELLKYMEVVYENMAMFDFPLHHNFYEASKQQKDYDLTKIFNKTLVQSKPELACTFIDNHDTQPLQSLEAYLDFWFIPLAYALILLRKDGFPCIFYPSLYGATYNDSREGYSLEIELIGAPHLIELILARKLIAYGEQRDYFDHSNCIGWTRSGIKEKENSGCAVIMSNGDHGNKWMSLGKENANKTFADITFGRKEKIKTNENGEAMFLVNGSSVSVWVKEEMLPKFENL